MIEEVPYHRRVVDGTDDPHRPLTFQFRCSLLATSCRVEARQRRPTKKANRFV